MPIDSTAIARNLSAVRARIERACERTNRDPSTVKLIAVTKSVGIDEVRILRDLGITEFGENRVHDAQPKIEAIHEGVRWHMIGHVQRRKARDVAALFDCVDSVDRIELAEALNQRVGEGAHRLPVLIEVNVSGEASKAGFTPAEIEKALPALNLLEHIDIQGLMTMAPIAADPESARPHFVALRALGQRLGLRELSMGMTDDFEVAIEEGATQVRIGRALFRS